MMLCFTHLFGVDRYIQFVPSWVAAKLADRQHADRLRGRRGRCDVSNLELNAAMVKLHG